MKKVIILFFIISNCFLLYGQSTTIPLVIEKSYQLKDIPSPQDIAWDGNVTLQMEMEFSKFTIV